ncbi:hypothetical protein N1031_12705 [Herbiconiux moechotypicola]|uniref:hypothetical protein n=1 Tax=Herbiconiux moechotypicola TaxID=637393 RepID=UPI00217EE470|nr:hypothetical protein [Herbiconiux moechotypicola]MCS5730624.1 hypothetical protein [Herbiconiux moechotypicola]
MTTPAPTAKPVSISRLLRHEFVTPESIYGTILVSAIIVLVEDGESDFSLLVTVAASSFVFWVAHVFATTVAHHGRTGAQQVPLGEALAYAVRHSAGLLTSAIIPILVLALGAVGVLDEAAAYQLSLLVGVLILVVLGWLAFADRGARWYTCLLAGAVTGLLGVAVIMLKVVFH